MVSSDPSSDSSSLMADLVGCGAVINIFLSIEFPTFWIKKFLTCGHGLFDQDLDGCGRRGDRVSHPMSRIDTKRSNWAGLLMAVDRGIPEVAGNGSKRR